MGHRLSRPALLAVTLAIGVLSVVASGCAQDRWIVNDMEVELFDRLKPVAGSRGDTGRTVYSGEERISMISSSHPEYTRPGGTRTYRAYKPIDPLTMGDCFRLLIEYGYFSDATRVADGAALEEARKRRAQTAIVVKKSGETWLLVNTGAKEGGGRTETEKQELQRFVNIKVMVTNMSRIGVEFAPAVALGDGAAKLEDDFNDEKRKPKNTKPAAGGAQP